MALTIRNNDIKHQDRSLAITVNIKEALESEEYFFYGTDAFMLEALYILQQDTWTIMKTDQVNRDGKEVYKPTNIKGAFEILRS